MPPVFRQYLELTKPRVVALIVFTAIIGMFLAVPGMVPLQPLVFGTIGIWLAAASAAAITHLIDQRIDRLMVRTSHRPLATGALSSTQVLVFAIALGVLSMTILIALVNPLTAALTFASLIGYAIGWGTTIPQEPYVPEVKAGDWKTILELEAEWKKSKGYT